MYAVTGGAGFIGSNIVAALEARGAETLVCDRLGRTGKWQNLARRAPVAIVPPPEIEATLDAHAGALRAVIHMGAITDTTESDADRLAADNLRAAQTLWHWCARWRVPFIYASSAATYGDGAQGFDDDPAPAALARLRPLNAYAWSKLAFDRWVVARRVAGAPTPPQWVGLKPFNVYGPNEYHKGAQASVVAHIFNQIQSGEPARLFRAHRPDLAHGEQRRDFVWVGDVVDVVLWLLDQPRVSGLFNLGTGRARSFNDLARAVFAALDRAPEIAYIDMPAPLRAQYQSFTQAETGRLRAAGYRAPFTDLETGIARYVRDYLNRDDPFR